jgi:dTDP-4-dehydrorhamnose reductase
MRILIFGATGLLGNALMREWASDQQVIGLGSKEVDIRSAEQVERVVKQNAPEWIVLAAAYADVDGCETNRDLAWDVNCKGAVNVVQAAKQSRARVIFLSTDYVFDGTKRMPYEIGDPRAARAVYGKTKAEAEERILELMPECCVLRTSWVFGMGGKCFPDTILKHAAIRSELEVVDDQRGCPTYTVDLARTIRLLIEKKGEGILHGTNRGDCTWYEFAREIVSKAGLRIKVMPTTSERFVRPAERPKYSVLSSASLERLEIEMPTWQDALGRYLAERSAVPTSLSTESHT